MILTSRFDHINYTTLIENLTENSWIDGVNIWLGLSLNGVYSFAHMTEDVPSLVKLITSSEKIDKVSMIPGELIRASTPWED